MQRPVLAELAPHGMSHGFLFRDPVFGMCLLSSLLPPGSDRVSLCVVWAPAGLLPSPCGLRAQGKRIRALTSACPALRFIENTWQPRRPAHSPMDWSEEERPRHSLLEAEEPLSGSAWREEELPHRLPRLCPGDGLCPITGI